MPIEMTLPDDKAKKIIASVQGTNDSSSQIKTGYSNSYTAKIPITKEASLASNPSIIMGQPMFFSPLHTPQNWQIASKRREVMNWCRFYYLNEPAVAAGIDFYSTFPLNGFKLQGCKSKKTLMFYERLVDKLKLTNILKLISKEYYMLGEVFPFIEIECPHCGGKGTNNDGEPCNHPNGTIKRVVIFNPDYVEVVKNPISNESIIVLVPDEELRQMVQKKQPAEIYNRLSKEFINAVLTKTPIKLSNRCISHLKYGECFYDKYGTSILRRLFTTLAYKTKLMTANWIVAERLILPVRVVKVGSADHPASDEELASVSAQLAAVANDPNLTLVTHHAFEYDWIGASGKIQTITTELEYVKKEILDGLMLNQALLNGEGPSWSGAQVGVETMLRRLENWRNELAEWVERHVFLPVAMMQGFIDKEASEISGEIEYDYPRIKWNDLNIRDNSNKIQIKMQLHDKKLISSRDLLRELDIDFDQMIEEMREESTIAGATGQLMGGGAGGGGMSLGGGMGGGLDLGGGAGGPPMGGDMGGAAGGPPSGSPLGGDMGSPAGGPPTGGDMGSPTGSPAGGSTPTATASGGNIFISKKGKGKKKEEQEKHAGPQYKTIRLTKLEQKLFKAMSSLDLPYQLYGQYQVKVAGASHNYLLDFAYPRLGLAAEADGPFHNSIEARTRDQERDKRLAEIGWTVLRFNELAIEDNIEQIKKVIYSTALDLAKKRFSRKKASEEEINFIKTASLASLDKGYKEVNNSKELLNKFAIIDGSVYSTEDLLNNLSETEEND